MGLNVAAKPDSQDICFVPSGSYAEIVGKFRPDALAAGEIVDADGAVLGAHQGIARYTVGQAKRLGLPAAEDGETLVVRKIEPGTRRIVVGPRAAASNRVVLRDVNWLVDVPPEGLRVQAKLRARETPQGATVFAKGLGAEILLDQPALAAPGQAAVFYAGSRILGGGFIVS